jgi:hypothetical protein
LTIICIKDGVVAADGSSYQGNLIVDRNRKKIVRSKDGAVGAGAGVSGDTRRFREWFVNSSKEERLSTGPISALTTDKDSGFEAVWTELDGVIWNVHFDGKPHEFGSAIATCGSPWQLARGAMLAGASAEEAVRICIEHHDSASGEVQIERLADTKELEDPVDEDEPVQPAMFSEEWRQSVGLA